MPVVEQKMFEVMSYDALEKKIRDLIDPPDSEGNRSWRFYIKETFPDFVVVRDSNESKIWKVGYTLDAQENVTIGQWQEAEYVLQVKPNGSTNPNPDPIVLSEQAEEGELLYCTRLTEAAQSLGGNKFRMTVMRPGWNVRLDGNPGDRYYTRQFITSLVPLIEGCKAYTDHMTEREERERPANSVLKLAGHWTEAKLETDGSATATFNLSESAAWLRPILLDAEKLKNEKGIVFVGPSINGFGLTRPGEAEGRRGKIAESIKLLQSIDIVTEPGAGGTVDKLLEGAGGNKEDDIVDWTKVTLDEIKQKRPDLFQAAGQEKLTEVQATFQTDLDKVKESVAAVDAENKRLQAELTAERTKVATKERIATMLKESKLPDVSQNRLAVMLESKSFVKDGTLDEVALKEAVDSAVADEKAYLGKLTESGRVVGMGSGGEPSNPVEKVKEVQAGFDKLFGFTAEQK